MVSNETYFLENFDSKSLTTILAAVNTSSIPGKGEAVRTLKRAIRANEDDEQLVKEIVNSRKGTKFVALMKADFNELSKWLKDPTPMKATYSLCGMLLYWTADPEQTNRIFHQSVLYKKYYNGSWDLKGCFVRKRVKRNHWGPSGTHLAEYWDDYFKKANEWRQVVYNRTPGEQLINWLFNKMTAFKI